MRRPACWDSGLPTVEPAGPGPQQVAEADPGRSLDPGSPIRGDNHSSTHHATAPDLHPPTEHASSSRHAAWNKVGTNCLSSAQDASRFHNRTRSSALTALVEPTTGTRPGHVRTWPTCCIARRPTPLPAATWNQVNRPDPGEPARASHNERNAGVRPSAFTPSSPPSGTRPLRLDQKHVSPGSRQADSPVHRRPD